MTENLRYRPATWKPVLLIVVYLAFYLAVGQLIGLLFGDHINADDLLAAPTGIFLGLVLPIAIGAAALLVFTWRAGWLRDVFGPQPIRGRGWMWIGPVPVFAAVVGHVGATDRSAWSAAQVALIVLAGLCIGVAEELATRGLAVKMLRDAGHGERFVAVVSSLLFALMHTTNLLAGMTVTTVATTVLYTFCFGICMYLAMRVTGSIWAAVILHAITDPTTFLSTGGIDQTVGTGGGNGWATLAALATIGFMLFAAVAVALIRGRTKPHLPIERHEAVG
ncbi:CPBP family intramembrane glutamic endopeptidase [Actinoplanes sp. HUAS TT8]|uniref:CPBP family intramembrane glutamic endopeptidase n=1 Tax=Actinoplanes sp. HUAS TT8 TaxID=3447453 RepID=UPI003F51DB86